MKTRFITEINFIVRKNYETEQTNDFNTGIHQLFLYFLMIVNFFFLFNRNGWLFPLSTSLFSQSIAQFILLTPSILLQITTMLFARSVAKS